MNRLAAALGAALMVWAALWASGLDHSLSSWLDARSIAAHAVAPLHVRLKAARARPVVLGKRDTRVFSGLRSSVSKTPELLVLTGTLPGRTPHQGLAFIGVDARYPQTYSAGALLANGARLVEIFPRYVVLKRGRQQARLYLGGGRRKARSGEASLLTAGGRETYTSTVAKVHEQFTEFIRETPVYDGPTLRGFRVYPGKQASVFARMGLQPGDLITSVDGTPLTDPTEAVAVFRELTAGSSENVDVTRGGKSNTVTLNGSFMADELEREQEAPNGSAPGWVPSK